MDGAKRVIVSPLPQNRLVAPEALAALSATGWHVASWPEEELTHQCLARLFTLLPQRSGLPAYPSLFFSVNFHGLDKFGENFAVLHAKGVPVAVWCVDNPWNLLSGLRDAYWKKTYLFVTDPSFIPGLKAHGAQHVSFLPLAADPTVFNCKSARTANADPVTSPFVFVGRSAFPDRQRFFVGQAVPEPSLKKSLDLTRSGIRTDFAWWLNELEPGKNTATLWPGSAARRASLGADEASLAWRTACLAQAASVGLTVHGDDDWEDLLPGNAALRGPVDYYHGLASIYANAPFSLNMMSFLLPHGLNQRHFDVWASGGFCLMDNCPGLDIFPSDLTTPVSFRRPGEISAIARQFTQDRKSKTALAQAWRDLILGEHTYAVRMRSLTKSVFF